MIDYQRDQQQTIPVEQVKIIGVGGAGANMLDRVALDGSDTSSMLALNSDSRTLNTAMAGEKLQLGKQLTMGLGSGGDPDVGLRAAQEVETEIRDALRNQKIVFICVGLGGGTGSGAAPLVTRLAREAGAFVVVFATMPFEFEGRRRREQAETSLNELSVLSNALVTFDNGKMGELVLASQGIHEAFAAADVMISQSIKAVTRLVVKPGIINVGLDDLMSALKATKSRCLFGSGISGGENRSQAALKNALNSPLLDKGALLRSATTVLVHICGGATMSLYEVELLMRELSKHVPESAHILFGAAVDDSMGDNLSVTLISALPEALLMSKASRKESEVINDVVETKTSATKAQSEAIELNSDESRDVEQPVEVAQATEPELEPELLNNNAEKEVQIVSAASTQQGKVVLESVSSLAETAEPEGIEETQVKSEPVEPDLAEENSEEVEKKVEQVTQEEIPEVVEPELEPEPETPASPAVAAAPKEARPQTELALDGGPKGKFSGETPNIVDGEDLDIPPFLRNR